MIVSPSIDGSSSSPRERPILRPPVQPEQELSIVVGREHGVVLVVQREVFALRRHLDDLLADLDAEGLKTSREMNGAMKIQGFVGIPKLPFYLNIWWLKF